MKLFIKISLSKIVLSLLLIALMAAAICSLNLSYTLENQAANQAKEFENAFVKRNILNLSDEFINEEWVKLRDDPQNVEKLRQYNTLLHQSTAFEFVEGWATLEYIFHETFKGGDQFFMDSTGASESLKRVNVALVGEGFDAAFAVETQNNRWFSAEDYFYQEGDVIPIVLGDEYRPFYAVGDEIHLRSLGQNLTGKVLDFAKPNSKMISYSTVHYLDRRIIIPMPNFRAEDLETQDREQLFRRYLDKNMGLIFTSQSYDSVKQITDDYAAQCGLVPHTLVDNAANSALLLSSMRTYALGALLLTVFLCVLSIVLLILLFLSKLKMEKEALFVHRVFAKSNREVSLPIGLCLLVYVALSYGVSCILHALFPIGLSFHWPIALCFCAVLLAAAFVATGRYLKKIDVHNTGEGE